jgi:hypothetical protein
LDHQSRPSGRQEKTQRDHLIRRAAAPPAGALGGGDDVWWSCLAQPARHTWAPDERAWRLVENTWPPEAPDPKALAGDGRLRRATPTTPEQIWLRCATGQPVSSLTTQLLAWCCDRLAALETRALVLVWDNASWPESQEVRT